MTAIPVASSSEEEMMSSVLDFRDVIVLPYPSSTQTIGSLDLGFGQHSYESAPRRSKQLSKLLETA